MSVWTDMNPAQRNHFIGELMQVKPLSQCFLAVDGKRVLATPYTEEQRAQVDAMLIALRHNAELREELLRNNLHIAPDMVDRLELEIERTHIRYSDTPGGGWVVVRFLRYLGYDVEIHLRPERDLVTVRLTKDDAVQVRAADTMEQAACLALVKIKAPEALA